MPKCPNCQHELVSLGFYGQCPHCQFAIAGDYGAFRPDDWIEWADLEQHPEWFYDRDVTLIYSLFWVAEDYQSHG